MCFTLPIRDVLAQFIPFGVENRPVPSFLIHNLGDALSKIDSDSFMGTCGDEEHDQQERCINSRKYVQERGRRFLTVAKLHWERMPGGKMKVE